MGLPWLEASKKPAYCRHILSVWFRLLHEVTLRYVFNSFKPISYDQVGRTGE